LSKLTLLIDAVMVSSPGMQQLQHELTLSSIRQIPRGYKIVLFQNLGSSEVEPQNGLHIEKFSIEKFGYVNRWLWYNVILPKKITEYNVDVLYSLSGIISKKISSLCATISTVNNMVPFTEMQFKHYPLLSHTRLKLYLFRLLSVSSMRMSTTVILHSRHALEQIKKYIPDIETKTTVVLTGISDEYQFRKKPQHPRNNVPYFFYLSAIYWYKNHINLIEGYRLALNVEINLPELLIAGYPEDKEYLEKFEKKIQEDQLSDKVKYIGSLDSEVIPAFIHHAVINFFPSTCETNSVVQAEIIGMQGVMACSDQPPMPEIPGDAAVTFDPNDPESIAACMIKVYNDNELQISLRKKAAIRSEELSWDKCGEAIWESAEKANKMNNFDERDNTCKP
jgi:glycosyltransferase involved in cell wall biosynthesis